MDQNERVARIDERLDHIHEDLREYRKEVIGIFGKLAKTERSVAILKRDRWWVFTLVGGAFAILVAYVKAKI